MARTLFKSLLISSSAALLLTACGGGGGGSTPLSQLVNQSPSTATDYTTYSWGLGSSINSSFQSTYNIDSDAHINLANAWAQTKGQYTVGANVNQAVKVAVIDEDFDVNHPDISGKVISAFNAMDSSSNIADSDGDTYYHGLAVAGFIASTYLGVAPDVELILINIDLESNSLTDADVIRAFDHAQAQGAKVINCSWGGGALSNSIQNKISDLKTAGITVIFASGNGDNSGNAINLDDAGQDDPSELTTVIGVGATSVLNDVTTYSNYGSTIDVLAPGGGGRDGSNNSLLGILGLDQVGNAGENTLSDTVTGNDLVNLNYSFTQGTSFSAPITSGVAALMYAVNPNITPDRLRTILTTTAEQVGTTNGADYSTGNFDTRRAYGKIHAGNAVTQAQAEYVP